VDAPARVRDGPVVGAGGHFAHTGGVGDTPDHKRHGQGACDAEDQPVHTVAAALFLQPDSGNQSGMDVVWVLRPDVVETGEGVPVATGAFRLLLSFVLLGSRFFCHTRLSIWRRRGRHTPAAETGNRSYRH